MFLYTNPLFCNMFFSSLSERLSFSDLSYIVIKVIVASSIRTKASFFKVITLAPPLFPRPLLDMASRTFRNPLPQSVPDLGLFCNSFAKLIISCFSEG